MIMNSDLKKAEPMDGMRVRLLYGDGFTAVLDLAPALHGPIFEQVLDPDFFRRLQVESDTIRWPNGADIDPHVLRLWAEMGSVLSQAETDAYFAPARTAA